MVCYGFIDGPAQHLLLMNTGQNFFYGKGDRAECFLCNDFIRGEEISFALSLKFRG